MIKNCNGFFPSTSGLVNESQIKDLPLNGRSFDQLLTLNTGTTDNRANEGWSGFSEISIVTSSGTNQLHGDVFEFLRNSDFDARNFFDQTSGTPPFKRNQFGGALGGPFKKDKLFLFGNYEAFRQRLALRPGRVYCPAT